MSVISAGLRQPGNLINTKRTHVDNARRQRCLSFELRRSQLRFRCAGVDLSPTEEKMDRTNGAAKLVASQPVSESHNGNGLPYSEHLEDDSREHVRMPLVDAVKDRGRREKETAFHIPGHKRGAGAPDALIELLGGKAAFQHDLTELPGACCSTFTGLYCTFTTCRQ